MTKQIPPELVAEAQTRLDRIAPPSRDYQVRLASFAWQPISVYDKAAAPTVLLRRDEHVCAGSWTAAVLFPGEDGEPGETWRSAEDATLEMSLQFEPDEFVALDPETLHGFIATGSA